MVDFKSSRIKIYKAEENSIFKINSIYTSEIFLKTQSTTKNTNILITKYGTISLHIDINFIGNSSFTD